MPNSSKKSKKPSRLSRLIAGMQSPKRASSLVVETGFPTSLIDLFVKNRDRLKKKKKKSQMEISKPVSLSSPPTELPSPEDSVIEGETLRQGNGEVIGGIKAVEMLKKDEEKNNNVVVVVDDDDGFVKNVFVQFFKMSVVVVLGLSTKRLVVGVTLSAFLLLFFELVGRSFKGLFQRCKDGGNVNGLVDENESNGNGVGSRLIREEEIRVDGVGIVEVRPSDCSSGELIEGGVIKDLIEEDGAEFCKNKKKGKKKFIKKIVKRLKTVKERKKKKEGKEGVGGGGKGDEFFSSRYEFIEEKCGKELQEQDDGEEGFSVSSREQESEILSSGELCRAEAESSISEEIVGNGKKKNSGYLILVLVVLAGLFGGRMMALAITIAWCVMLKFVNKLTGYCEKLLMRVSSP